MFRRCCFMTARLCRSGLCPSRWARRLTGRGRRVRCSSLRRSSINRLIRPRCRLLMPRGARITARVKTAIRRLTATRKRAGAAQGVDEWLVFELKEEASIASLYTHFNNGASRVYGYELYASTDGVNFTKILTHESSGTSDTETVRLDAPVTAKYIKYVGKGNSANTWNSVQEIEFRTK